MKSLRWPNWNVQSHSILGVFSCKHRTEQSCHHCPNPRLNFLRTVAVVTLEEAQQQSNDFVFPLIQVSLRWKQRKWILPQNNVCNEDTPSTFLHYRVIWIPVRDLKADTVAKSSKPREELKDSFKLQLRGFQYRVREKVLRTQSGNLGFSQKWDCVQWADLFITA